MAGLRVAEFLGGKHANFNMALWRSDVAAHLEAGNVKAVLARLGREADLLKLINQPLTWGGATNPFALLPHQRAANYAFSGGLIPDFDALLRARTNAAARKKMRKKERTLAGYGAVRFERAEGQRDVRQALDVFFKQKSARMRAQGLHDVFADPNVRRFVEDGGDRPPARRHAADRALCALGRRHGRGDHGRHRRRAAASAPCSIRSPADAMRSRARASS